MTTTIHHTHSTSRTTTSGTETLLELLGEALLAAADQDPDRLHSGTTAGRALVALSTLAREAARAPGADAGPLLIAGPGVVVVRELAAATRQLDRASLATADGTSRDVGSLLATAKGLHAQLLEAIGPSAGRRPGRPQGESVPTR